MLRPMVLVLIFLECDLFFLGARLATALWLWPHQQREPQRVHQQIRPHWLKVLSEAEAEKLRASAASVPVEPQCLQSDWLDAPQAAALYPVLEASLPKGGWTLTRENSPERWIIYSGRYANAAELTKKRLELTRMDIKVEVLHNALAPGLSLGAYESQAQAQTAMDALTQHGVHTARIIMERAAEPGFRLRLTGFATANELNTIKSALPGNGLKPC